MQCYLFERRCSLNWPKPIWFTCISIKVGLLDKYMSTLPSRLAKSDHIYEKMNMMGLYCMSAVHVSYMCVYIGLVGKPLSECSVMCVLVLKRGKV